MLADKASDQQKGARKCPGGQNHSNNASHKRKQLVYRKRKNWGGGVRVKSCERNRLASVLRCMSNNQDDNELKLLGNKTI